MEFQKFELEMRNAEAMRRTVSPERIGYWTGYIRGLRRAYHGDNFGTSDEHEVWSHSSDQRGQGYRDGLAYGDNTNKTTGVRNG